MSGLPNPKNRELWAFQLRRLREYEKQGEAGKRGDLLDQHSALMAGRELRRLYERVRKLGISRTKIEHEIAIHSHKRKGRAKTDDPVSFKLGRWTIPKKYDQFAVSDIAKLKNPPKPQKNVVDYLFAVECLAEFLDEDSDEAKLKMLFQTPFWSNGGRSASETPSLEAATELSFKFNELARTFAKKHRLGDVLRRAAGVPGRWDRIQECFAKKGAVGFSTECPVGYSFDETEWPPFPSVSAIKIPYAIVKGPLLMECSSRPAPLGYEGALNEPIADGQVEEIPDATAILYRDIRLTVAPINPTDFEMLLETRGQWTLSSKRLGGTIDAVVDHVGIRRGIFVYEIFADGWRRIWFPPDLPFWADRCTAARFRDWPECFDLYPIGDQVPEWEYWYTFFTRADPAILEHWFGRHHPDLFGERLISEWELFGGDNYATYYVRNVPARWLEVALHTGAVEEKLEQSFNRISQALDEREAEWREDAARETEELIARWGREANGVDQEGQDQ